MDANKDLEKALTFYQKYHNEWRNILIHFIFVPILLYTGFVIVHNIFPVVTFLAFICYSTYYIYLDPVIGLTYIPVMLSMMIHINSISLTTAILIHVSSWIVQILSHKYFEGNTPALKDGLLQAITIAPLFTWYEMYKAFGYRKEFFSRIESNVNELNDNK